MDARRRPRTPRLPADDHRAFRRRLPRLLREGRRLLRDGPRRKLPRVQALRRALAALGGRRRPHVPSAAHTVELRGGHAEHLRCRSTARHRPLDHRHRLPLLPRNCDVDRQARGSLENFSSWSAHVDGGLNAALEDFHPGGNIGDRDFIKVAGGSYNIHEVQFTKGAFGSWRVYLFDWLTGVASPLAITTHRGSTAFANPTFTSLISPAGRPALLVTLFIPSQGAAPGESGELIYYRELP